MIPVDTEALLDEYQRRGLKLASAARELHRVASRVAVTPWDNPAYACVELSRAAKEGADALQLIYDIACFFDAMATVRAHMPAPPEDDRISEGFIAPDDVDDAESSDEPGTSGGSDG